MDQYSTLANADLPHQIPATSAFYKVRAMGRRALPEQFNELFVVSFSRACESSNRDYRGLYYNVLAQAQEQTSHTISKRGSVFGSFKRVWKDCCSETRSHQQTAELYCAIFAAAIEACPNAQEDIYE
jgi:hypothetical protein